MKNTTAYLLALTLVGIVGVGFASALGPRLLGDESNAAIQQAIENNDFEAWKTAAMETLTQENFDKLVEQHNSMSERMELQNAMKQSIKSKNYTAYKEAAENLRDSQKVMDEEEFNAMNGRGFGSMNEFIPRMMQDDQRFVKQHAPRMR